MCNFLSVVSDIYNKVYFFNAQQREELNNNNPKNYKPDSHTSIASFYGLNDDKVNKFEVDIFPELKVNVDTISIKDNFVEVEKYCKKHLINDFGGIDAIMGASFVIKDGVLIKYNNIGLTSVVIPDSVTSIGSWAFDGNVIINKLK